MGDFAYNPRLKVREYKPTKDWAGIGYNHHMVVTEDSKHSGVGASRSEALQDLVRNRRGLNDHQA